MAGLKKLSIRNATKIQKAAIKNIAPWVVEHLVGKKLARNIEIRFQIMKGLMELEKLEGMTSWEDDNHKPREFLIEIDKSLEIEDFILTMCHELVHVKQYATGEMKDLFKGPHNLVWRGNKINTLVNNIPYWEQPWEIEAFGREQGLYIMWKEANHLKDCESFEKCLKYL